MGGKLSCIRGEFVPVPDCAGEEGAASVVRAAAECCCGIGGCLLELQFKITTFF